MQGLLLIKRSNSEQSLPCDPHLVVVSTDAYQDLQLARELFIVRSAHNRRTDGIGTDGRLQRDALLAEQQLQKLERVGGVWSCPQYRQSPNHARRGDLNG